MTRALGIALTTIAAALASASPAAAAAKKCGTERDYSGGMVFRVEAVNATCATAQAVAGSWFSETSDGKSGRRAYDQAGDAWSCRSTFQSKGSDTSTPYSKYTCKRKSRAIRFQLRS
ncbi:MAG: hypothetical protein Q7T73_22490 [Beijerinckiaceae bacterium]|nr:hypothetical protein [Beijerinckiaceae bacterium]